MLKQGALADGQDATASTLLAAAVSNGISQVVKVLLDNGADPNSPVYRAYPPLIIAAKQGDTAVTELLLKAGALPDTITSSTQPALTLAARKGFPEVVKLLLEFGADPNIVSFAGSTPLLQAITSNCNDCVRHLLEAGADGSGKTRDGETPLVLALQSNNREIVNILGKVKTRIGSWNDLSYAVNTMNTQLLETVLEFGIDPNSRDEKGNTVLFNIAYRNKYYLWQAAPEIARILLEHGADPDFMNGNNTTALFWAANNGKRAVAEILIKNGADINIAGKDGHTPLLLAIMNKHYDIANELLAAGADPNLQTVGHMNKVYPLIAAIQQNNPEMIKQLFESGAVVDPTSRDLCDLIEYGAQSPEVIRIIADSGVELNHRDPFNRYPLSVLVRHGHPESIAYLLKKGAEPLLPEWKGMQPFMHFVRNNQADLVAASIEASQALRENEKQMRDGMYWAVRSAHPEVVKVLLKEGTFFQGIESVEALLKWAKTPPATEADKQEIMRLLTERFKAQ